MRAPKAPLGWLGAAALAGLLWAPTLVLVLQGAAHAGNLPAAAGQYAAVSLGSSALALVIIVVGGTPLAWWLARGERRPLWAELVLSVPLLMPPLVVGLVLEYLIGFQGAVGLGWTNTFAGLVTASVYEAAPYYVFVAWSAFLALPEAQWESALALGWPPLKSFFKVALPWRGPAPWGRSGRPSW
jgi:ABC-type sulfate transport system permease component